MADEKEEKLPPYYRTIVVKNHDLDTAQAELDRKSNEYEKTNKVLHRHNTVTYGYQIWAVTRSFCCETEEEGRY